VGRHVKTCRSDPVVSHPIVNVETVRRAEIVAPVAAVRSPLVIHLRLERNPEPLDSARIAGFVKLNASDADARIVTLRNEPWEKAKLTIRAANCSGIQNSFVRITWFRLYEQPQTLQSETTHRLSSSRSLLACTPHKHAMIVSITRFDSSVSLTWIDSTPASLTG
jgi:hypothetical protein